MNARRPGRAALAIENNIVAEETVRNLYPACTDRLRFLVGDLHKRAIHRIAVPRLREKMHATIVDVLLVNDFHCLVEGELDLLNLTGRTAKDLLLVNLRVLTCRPKLPSEPGRLQLEVAEGRKCQRIIPLPVARLAVEGKAVILGDDPAGIVLDRDVAVHRPAADGHGKSSRIDRPYIHVSVSLICCSCQRLIRSLAVESFQVVVAAEVGQDRFALDYIPSYRTIGMHDEHSPSILGQQV